MSDCGRPKTARMRAIRRNKSETERSLGTSDLACRSYAAFCWSVVIHCVSSPSGAVEQVLPSCHQAPRKARCGCTPTYAARFSVGLDLRNDRPVASILQPYSPMSLAAARPRPHEARSDTRIALARWGRQASVQKQKVCEIQVYVC
ncbi:unnamed protein product [Cercospora beticola]|nr:unnamed protein product [Cercospora beticola]